MSMVIRHPEITTQRPHWVADDAVRCAPVSAAKFPENRENNREFFNFGPNFAILASNRRATSMACREIPYATEQGIFGGITGNFFQGTGNSLARTGNSSSDQYFDRTG